MARERWKNDEKEEDRDRENDDTEEYNRREKTDEGGTVREWMM